MRKISIITIFDNPNFGTYLQALALGVVFERFNTKVEIVHYERPAWHKHSSFKKKTKFLEPLRYLLAYIKRDKRFIQQYCCRKFVKKYISVTSPYYSYSELEKNSPKADIYVTGSDQVWNTTHNHGLDKAFYLGFVRDCPKYAYGASIGMDSIPDEYKDETRRLLMQYRHITVREQSNVDLLSDIGIKSSCVIDPTLLLSQDDWRRYTPSNIGSEPYLLAYSVETKDIDITISKIARRIADKLHLKIYEVNYFGSFKTIPGCDRHFYYATPDVFLSLVGNASVDIPIIGMSTPGRYFLPVLVTERRIS